MQQDTNTTTESLLNEVWNYEVIEKDGEIHIIESKNPTVAIATIYAEPLGHEEYERAKLICSAPKLSAENERLKRLLHDLTPQGSEFYNDPEYCAKWVRANRLEEKQQLTKIIADLKKENASISFDLQCAATDKLELEQKNKQLEEALQEVTDFLHVLPMLRLGNKQGFDECVDINGVTKLEELAKAALQTNK